MSSQLYILKVDLNIGQQTGIDLAGSLDKLNALLMSYTGSATCLYKYKVTGEARVVTVFEVTNIIGLERIVAGIARLGNMEVTCQPMIWYQKFAEFLGVEENLRSRTTDTLEGDVQLYWIEFSVEYPGKSTTDLLATWQREAIAALTARNSSGHLELFKVVGERKVHAFIAMEAAALDDLTFNLPVMQENGNGVTIINRALQSLDDYCTRMPTEPL